MTTNKSLDTMSIFLLIIAVLFWGWAFPLIKITLEFVPPLVIGYFRYLIASLPFLGYLFYKYGLNETMKQVKGSMGILCALGITMVTLPNITQNIGLLYTTSSIAALISTVAPIFTIFIAITFLKESKSFQKIIGMLIALIASLLIVFYTDLEVSNSTLFGNTLIFITAVSYGISGIFSKTVLEKCSPVHVAGFAMFIGAVLLIPLSPIFGEPLDWAIHLPIDGWIYLLTLTLLPCMVATFLWYVVLQGHEVSKQVLFTYLIPVFAAVFAYLMLGEVLTPYTILLGALIIFGITIAEMEFKKNKK